MDLFLKSTEFCALLCGNDDVWWRFAIFILQRMGKVMVKDEDRFPRKGIKNAPSAERERRAQRREYGEFRGEKVRWFRTATSLFSSFRRQSCRVG